MSDLVGTMFAAGAVFLAVLVNGYLVEWIASYFVSNEASQFGGFCFVLGGVLLGSKSIFDSSSSFAVDAGVAIGCLAGVIFLGARMFRMRQGREASR